MLKSPSQTQSKSPMTLLLLIACLVIGTLVMISNYFFRPGLELDLRNKIVTKLYSYSLLNPVVKVEGRDVILRGIVQNKVEAEKIETEILSISGINNVESFLLLLDKNE